MLIWPLQIEVRYETGIWLGWGKKYTLHHKEPADGCVLDGNRSRHILLGGLTHGNREKAPILAKWPQKQTLWLRLAKAAGVLGTYPALLGSELCLAHHNWVLMNFLDKSRGASTRPDGATLSSLASPTSNHRHVSLVLPVHCHSHLFSALDHSPSLQRVSSMAPDHIQYPQRRMCLVASEHR